MATKKSSAKKQAKRKAPSKTSSVSLLDRILDAGLDEAAAAGWRHATLDGVAERAGIGLGELLIEVPTKTHFALKLIDRVDARTLAPVKKVETDDTPRDRLFEILMRRFDVLNGHRDGYRSIIMSTLRNPCAVPLVMCRLHRSLSAILTAAGVSASGLIGLLRMKGLAAIGAFSLRAWMRDDTEDLSKTMAALDRALARAERLAGFAPFRRGRKESEAAA